MKAGNPFLIQGYISPVYFCDRLNETSTIIDAVDNRRNITIYSLRRIGKTGLIRNAFYKLNKSNGVKLFYIDIYPTSSLPEFTALFAKEIFRKLDSNIGNVISKISGILSSIRPQLSYDPLSGNPSIHLDVQNEKEAKVTLEEIFAYIRTRKERIIIAIDEFQQILNYPEKNIEALLRKHIQSLSNTTFIFSGSQQEMLLSMFGNRSRPFYQSTQLLHLEKINRNTYKKFIISKFTKAGRSITGIEVDYILDWTKNHTYYVQFVCNRLFSKHLDVIKIEDIKSVLQEILNENQVMFLNYRNFLTENQWRLLTAIAKEGQITQITSKAFLTKYQLGTPSSVKTSIKPLLQKELVYYDQKEYKIYDVFFQRWAEYMG